MSIDTRDWYKNLLRKKTGYVERSTFRRPAVDEEVLRVLGPPARPRPPLRKVKQSLSFWHLFGGAVAGFLMVKVLLWLLGLL